jgi:hypothetical protein
MRNHWRISRVSLLLHAVYGSLLVLVVYRVFFRFLEIEWGGVSVHRSEHAFNCPKRDPANRNSGPSTSHLYISSLYPLRPVLPRLIEDVNYIMCDGRLAKGLDKVACWIHEVEKDGVVNEVVVP